MELICKDGQKRRFEVAEFDEIMAEARCLECGREFSIAKIESLKRKMKRHICRNKGGVNEIKD